MGSYHADIDADALEFLADVCNGDARAALTAIELGILTTERGADGVIHITIDVASECIQKRVISYDKAGIIQQIRKAGELLEEDYRAEGIYVKAYVPMEVYGRL